MSARNYYLVLGIRRDENAAGVRAAYRQLAKQLHPDRQGPAATARFQELAEAYAVLSDPQQRRDYDAELRREASNSILRSPVEPISIFATPESIHPSHEALRDRFARNFTARGVPKAERMESLTLDVVLTPEEAALGGTLPIGIPIMAPCPACHGSGHDWMWPCIQCDARGFVETERTVGVRIPPYVRPGTILEVPLDTYGIGNLYLRVHVSVG